MFDFMTIFNGAFYELFVKRHRQYYVFLYINLDAVSKIWGEDVNGWTFFIFIHEIVGPRVHFFRLSYATQDTIQLRNHLYKEGFLVSNSYSFLSAESSLSRSRFFDAGHVQVFEIDDFVFGSATFENESLIEKNEFEPELSKFKKKQLP